LSPSTPSTLKSKLARLGLVAAATAVVSLPVISSRLNAQNPPPTGGAAAPATPAPPAVQPGGGAAGAPAPAPVGPKVDLTKVEPDKVVARAGDVQLTAGELNILLQTVPEAQRTQLLAQPGALRNVATEIIHAKALAKEAEGRKLDQSPRYKSMMDMARYQVLAQLLAEDVSKGVDDAQLKDYYGKNKDKMDQIKARHILVRTPGSRAPVRPGQKELTDEQAKTKADQLRARLAKGEDFAAVAKAESDDTGSGAQGGDLGSFGHGQMVPEFDKAAFGLKEGEISQPVKTQFGYHIIQVQDKLDTFEDFKEQLKQQVGPEKVQQYVKEFREKHQPQLDDAILGPAPAPALNLPQGAAPAPAPSPSPAPQPK
jgi:peptidyl-prolyl cis-trans isomerase C